MLCCCVEEGAVRLMSVSEGEAALAAAVQTVKLLSSSTGDSSEPGQLRESV